MTTGTRVMWTALVAGGLALGFAAWRSSDGAFAPRALASTVSARTDEAELRPETTVDVQPARSAVESDAPSGLRVVDGTSGRPVAGVEVHLIDFAMLAPEGVSKVLLGQSFTPSAVLRRVASIHTSDAHGFVRSIPPEFDLAVVDTGERFGWLARGAETPAAGPTLTLNPNSVTIVTVRDAEGRPAPGVTVSLRARHVDERSRTFGYLSTGAAGSVSFPLVDQWAVAAHVAEALELDFEFESVLHLGARLVTEPFDPRTVEGLDLSIPPSAAIAVRVVDARGRTPRSPVQLSIRGAAAGDPGLRVLTDASGVGVFPHVSPGADFEIIATTLPSIDPLDALELDSDPSLRSTLTVRAPGAGFRSEVDWTLDAYESVFLARFVEADGHEAWRSPVQVTLAEVGGFSRTRIVRPSETDESTFLFWFAETPGGPVAGERDFELRFTSVTNGADEGKRELRATRAIRPGEPHVHDLGQIVLESAAVRLAGRVVDRNGAPVAGARVSLVLARTEPLPAVVRGDDPRASWLDEKRFEPAAYSDAGGWFLVPDDGESWPGLEGGAWTAEVAKDGFQRLGPVPFLAGEVERLFELEELSVVHGTVLLDEALDPSAFEVLTMTDDELIPTGRRFLVAPDGNFRIEGAPYGALALLVRDTSSGTIVERLEGIEPRPVSDPGEGLRIDLRGRVTATTVELVGPDGRSVEGFVQLLPPAGASEAAQPRAALSMRAMGARRLRGERTFSFVAFAPVDLIVGARGFRTRLLPEVQGAVRIELEAGLAVDFEARCDDPGAIPWSALTLVATPQDPSLGFASGRWTGAFESRRCAAALDRPGPHSLEVEWRHDGADDDGSLRTELRRLGLFRGPSCVRNSTPRCR